MTMMTGTAVGTEAVETTSTTIRMCTSTEEMTIRGAEDFNRTDRLGSKLGKREGASEIAQLRTPDEAPVIHHRGRTIPPMRHLTALELLAEQNQYFPRPTPCR